MKMDKPNTIRFINKVHNLSGFMGGNLIPNHWYTDFGYGSVIFRDFIHNKDERAVWGAASPVYYDSSLIGWQLRFPYIAITLPDYLQNSLIAHELAHTTQPPSSGHTPNFYKTLEYTDPHHKESREKLLEVIPSHAPEYYFLGGYPLDVFIGYVESLYAEMGWKLSLFSFVVLHCSTDKGPDEPFYDYFQFDTWFTVNHPDKYRKYMIYVEGK